MPQEPASEHKYSLQCGLNSFISTYIAGLLHPLDVIKTRFQSHDGKERAENLVPKYNGIFNALKTIYREEGLRALFKGYHISMLAQASVTGMFFWLYELRKVQYMRAGYEEMTSVAIASSQASIFGTVVTQPLWVIKTRMLLNTKPNLSGLQNLLFSCQQIMAQDGLRGYGSGFNISLFLSFSGVLQMFVYQGSKKIYDSISIPQSMFSQKHFFCGALSKFFAVLITYPLTTVRTRAQQSQYIKNSKRKKYTGSLQIVRRTYEGEGLRGFYKGFQINILRGIMQRGIYFYCYQLLKTHLFGRLAEAQARQQSQKA